MLSSGQGRLLGGLSQGIGHGGGPAVRAVLWYVPRSAGGAGLGVGSSACLGAFSWVHGGFGVFQC